MNSQGREIVVLTHFSQQGSVDGAVHPDFSVLLCQQISSLPEIRKSILTKDIVLSRGDLYGQYQILKTVYQLQGT